MYVEDLDTPDEWASKDVLLKKSIDSRMESVAYSIRRMMLNADESLPFLVACHAVWGDARQPYEVDISWWRGPGGYVRIYLKHDEKFADYDHVVQGLIETGWSMQYEDRGVDRERVYSFERPNADGTTCKGSLVIYFGASDHCKVDRTERTETITRTVYDYKVECDDAPPPSIPEVTPEDSTNG